MKKKIIISVLIMCLSSLTIKAQTTNGFILKKGVNVASWLSLPLKGAVIPDFFTEADVIQLKNLGFDHIRLLVDEEILFNIQGQPNRKNAFDLLHNALGWCVKHDMRIIVDMHVTRNHFFINSENKLFTDPKEIQKFVSLWQAMSRELKKYPVNIVAYELLNEPITSTEENVKKWNTVVSKSISAIRKLESKRTIIVGVATVSTPFKTRYDLLQLPANKENILMTFHFYTPYLFTAFGQADTTFGQTDLDIQYPGRLVSENDIKKVVPDWRERGRKIYNIDLLRSELMWGIDRAKELKVPVFVGEFGVLRLAPEKSRLNWYRDVLTVLNENSIPYTSFDYKGAGYSIANDQSEILTPNLVKLLTGNENK